MDLLIQGEIIDRRLAYLVRSFQLLRNRAIHREIEITKGNLDEAIQIRETILSELERTYTKSQVRARSGACSRKKEVALCGNIANGRRFKFDRGAIPAFFQKSIFLGFLQIRPNPAVSEQKS